jgi:DNA-binding NarL/FixJ family response regulator
MADRRVFIAWSHSLFYGSVRLLLQHPDIEIIGANAESETLWHEVNIFRPDTIIIERRGTGDDIMLGPQTRDSWHPRIIHTGLHDNIAHVCRCEQHILEQADDLLRLVLNE